MKLFGNTGPAQTGNKEKVGKCAVMFAFTWKHHNGKVVAEVAADQTYGFYFILFYFVLFYFIPV
jgi:hypothetical protein